VTNAPAVSVITIFLNGEAFIQEAIESVVAQTFRDWELLLVDDGSTDASSAIAQRFAAADPDRIRYLEHAEHRNRGMSASRNLGIERARGTFIALLDADDVWLPDHLEQHVRRLHEHPEAGMVYGPSMLWYSWTGLPEDAARAGRRRLGVPADTLVRPPRLLELLLENRADTPATCSVLMRRSAVELAGGFEEEFRGLYEDQVFFAKLFLTIPIFVTGDAHDRYRQHADSCCFVAHAAGEYHFTMPHAARLPFLQWLERYLSEHGRERSRAWSLLQRELWWYRHPRLHRATRLITGLPAAALDTFWERLLPLGVRASRALLPKRARNWLWNRVQRRSPTKHAAVVAHPSHNR
jgi:glycosyltransferase involved in cell wall biosynthesis